MFKLYPEQLDTQLNEKLYAAYLLLGDDSLLLKESQDKICQIAASIYGFYEQHTIQVDNNTNWQEVFAVCNTISLFSSRKTLIIILPITGINTYINKQLITLVSLLHNDLLLLVHINKLTNIQENFTWFTRLSSHAVIVMCQAPVQIELSKWINTRAHKQYNLQLDESACRMLCYYYEGNLPALVQILNQLSILWPNSKITLSKVEQIIHDTSCFKISEWVNALFTAQSKRALHILRQLYFKGIDPVIILRNLQRELLLLLNISRQSKTVPIRILFDKYRILQNRWTMIINAINYFSHNQLRQAIHLLTQIEIALKRDYSQSIWMELENLSLLMCHKALADIFING